MKVSIITVCKNAELTISDTIKSVISQNYNDIEYIIIDGKSTDNTLKIINKYQNQISCLISEEDSGIYEAMNKGINLTTGELVFFLNSNDIFISENVVNETVKRAEKKESDIYYGDILFLYKNKVEGYIKKHNNISRFFMFNDCITHSAIFYKRSAFDKCGLFNDKLRITADYEWLLRAMYKHKLRFKYINLIISIFYEGGISTSNETRNLLKKERNAVINSYFNKIEVFLYSNFITRFLFLSLRFVKKYIKKHLKLIRKRKNK